MNKPPTSQTLVVALGLILLAALVSGCGATVQADSVAVQAESPDFVGVVWHWQETASSDDSTLTVDDPGRYTIEFMPDGRASIKADCNQVSWTYEVDGASLTFNTLGPSTLAACPPDSLADEYLAQLGATASYVINEGNLILNMMADGGNMIFGEAGSESDAEDSDTENADADIVAKFHALLPSDDSPGRYVTLVPAADGTVEVTVDSLNDSDPALETGVWERDGEDVVITLLESNGEPYDEPLEFNFVLDGDRLIAEDHGYVFYGTEDLPLNRRTAAAMPLDHGGRAFLTLDLEAGFPLDPFFVSVNGGGELDASRLGDGCSGWVHQEPVLSIDWEGETDFVEVFFYSDHDPMLIIQTPDGEYLCNDDANPLLLDPVIEVENPESGTYNIWVGSFHPNQLLPGVLVLTTKPEVNIGNFDLGGLIRRDSIPEILQTPEGQEIAQRVIASIEGYEGEVGSLSASDEEAAKVEVSAEGEIAAHEIPLVGDRCSGFINETPDYLFDWSGAAAELAIFFEGETDASLLVVTADQRILCNDDTVAAENINPLVLISDPAKGQYAVYVGRLNPEAPVSGVLTVTSLDQSPDVLAPAATQ